MFNGDKLNELDENTGPAFLNRKPLFMAEEREEMAENVRERINGYRS